MNYILFFILLVVCSKILCIAKFSVYISVVQKCATLNTEY